MQDPLRTCKGRHLTQTALFGLYQTECLPHATVFSFYQDHVLLIPNQGRMAPTSISGTTVAIVRAVGKLFSQRQALAPTCTTTTFATYPSDEDFTHEYSNCSSADARSPLSVHIHVWDVVEANVILEPRQIRSDNPRATSLSSTSSLHDRPP